MRAETPTLYPNTNAVFSPDDKYVITGAGAVTKGGNGKLLLLQKDNLEVVKALEIGATPVRVFWHSKINQVSHVMKFDGGFTHGCEDYRLSQASQTARYVCCTRQKRHSMAPNYCSTRDLLGR